MTVARTIARLALVLAVGLLAAVAGWLLFVRRPADLADLLGIVLVLATVATALRVGGNLASGLLPDYTVAEVAVEGTITRDGGGSFVSSPVGTTADEVVEQIERADADRSAEALLVKLNTPGGEIVPSEDIRLAAERFDGPTVAYATDVCASGGYDIASGCDELWAREGSIVGSIGVVGSRITAADLADRLGVSYEQFTAGEYKDAGTPLRDIEDDEREYLQGLVDDYYDQFVETVADGRDLDPDAVRETEARVYLGAEADERGLVDEIGTREAVEERLAELIGGRVEVREFRPERGLAQRLRGGAQSVAFALGAGIASVSPGDIEGLSFRE
ncbi:MAG: signal peptide peptidase SppA [Haloarculaceae archaeon]